MKVDNPKENEFTTTLSWFGALGFALYGYSLEGSWETVLWYTVAGFGIGSMAGFIIKGLTRWVVMTIVLLIGMFILKERIELVLGMDADEFLDAIAGMI